MIFGILCVLYICICRCKIYIYVNYKKNEKDCYIFKDIVVIVLGVFNECWFVYINRIRVFIDGNYFIAGKNVCLEFVSVRYIV